MGIEEQYKKLFEAESHKEAIDLLKKNKNSFDPALYHYNLGINYAKIGKLAVGRFHLEKSLQAGFYSPQVRDSLEHTKELLGVRDLEQKESISDYAYDGALNSSIFTGLNISLVLLIILFFQSKHIKQLWIKLSLALLALLPLGGQLYLKSNYSVMISLEESQVRGGPSKIFETNQEILPGMKFIGTKSFNGWRYVISPSSHKGWIESDSVVNL